MRIPGADQAIGNVIKWSLKDEWEPYRAEVFAEHFGLVEEKLGISGDEALEAVGEAADMVFGFILEDFFAARFGEDGELNVVDDYLKRRGWREKPSGKRYLQALRDSVASVYEVVDLDPGRTMTVRDLILGGDPVTLEEKLGSEIGGALGPYRRARRYRQREAVFYRGPACSSPPGGGQNPRGRRRGGQAAQAGPTQGGQETGRERGHRRPQGAGTAAFGFHLLPPVHAGVADRRPTPGPGPPAGSPQYRRRANPVLRGAVPGRRGRSGGCRRSRRDRRSRPGRPGRPALGMARRGLADAANVRTFAAGVDAPVGGRGGPNPSRRHQDLGRRAGPRHELPGARREGPGPPGRTSRARWWDPP